ncbi:hypothetical protein ACFP3U_07640 [Kitasatospora misakiensis]|uniref:Uncharacterized protein n=1 Tax=Kitasatospora misakiensis TaxID=67330 RepID=A0ABW0WZA5_9ACTN
MRRPFAAAALLGLAVLVTGCGIRPTAVPVDAGAPASRTACPTVARIPTAPSTPSAAAPAGGAGGVPPAPAHAAPVPGGGAVAARAGSASPSPVAGSPEVKSPAAGPSTAPADNVFGALPSPSASTTPPCR